MVTRANTTKNPPIAPQTMGTTSDESDELDDRVGVEDGNTVISDTTTGSLHCPSVSVVTALTCKYVHINITYTCNHGILYVPG